MNFDFSFLFANVCKVPASYITYLHYLLPKLLFIVKIAIFVPKSHTKTMTKIIKNLDQFNEFFHQQTAHPMVAVGDLSKADVSIFEPSDFGCYCVVMLDSVFGDLVIKGSPVSYRSGTVFTAKPGTVMSMKLALNASPEGLMLVFRPEMIENTGLGRDFYMFNFFDYEVSETLLLTESERRVMNNCFTNINTELHTDKDELTPHMLRLQIGQMLSYCKRFYERQFDMRKTIVSDFVKKLDRLLEAYLSAGSTMPAELGVPSVAWCANEMNLSANYFGSQVKKYLHVSAKEYIDSTVAERAKALLGDSSLSIDEVAGRLGFVYPNHFTRFFKRETGISPSAFRKEHSFCPLGNI